MEVERLLAVVQDVETEFEHGQTSLLQQLLQRYTTARNSPAQDLTEPIEEAHKKLNDYLRQSTFNTYSPSKTAILKALGGDKLTGEAFINRINEALVSPGMTTAGIVTRITDLQKEAEDFRKACEKASAGLAALGVKPYRLPQGAYDVGVLIPGHLVDNKLGALSKQFESWNKIIRAFIEVAGEDEREVRMRGLSTGSFELYVAVGVMAADLLARAIERLAELYLKILEIQKRRKELTELGAPVSEAREIKKFEKEFLEKEIKDLAKELIKQAHSRVDAGRRAELETLLTISLKQAATFIDRGGVVEVTVLSGDEPAEPEAIDDTEVTPEQKSEIDRLQKDYEKLKKSYEDALLLAKRGIAAKRLPDRHQPILQLEDDDDASAGEAERAQKRKQ
jgi:hypothetical protein